MKIVDAQVHMWAAGPPSGHHRQVPRFTADELLAEMAAAGVDAALIHPHLPWDPGANELACAAALERPHRFAVLGQLALERPESRALIDTWRDRPGMLGLRFSLTRPEEERWHVDGTMDWLWPAAERAGLPVATMAWRFLPTLASIAERHPALRLIIDHCGLVRAAKGEAAFAKPRPASRRGAAAQRRAEGHRRARLFDRGLPVPRHPRRAAPDLRRVRPRPVLLGHGPDADAVHLPGVRDDVHRGVVVAARRRTREGDGRGPVRLDRLARSVRGYRGRRPMMAARLAVVWRWFDATVLDLGRQFRLSYLPPLMVYLAAGVSGLTAIVGTFFVKERLDLSAATLASLAFWAGIPWALKMPLGHLVDLIWRWKAALVYLGAALIALSLGIMYGLVVDPDRMAAMARLEAWYVASVLLAPVGYALQDVVADAMTVEAVPSVDGAGEPLPDADVKAMHTTMQTLGRVAIISGLALVAVLNIGMFAGVERMTPDEKLATYARIYLMALAIPAISVLGVVLASAMRARRAAGLRAAGTPAARIAELLDAGGGETRPNWWILGGGAGFAIFTLTVGLASVPFDQEIIFAGSMAIVLFLMARLVRELPEEARGPLVGTAIIVFVFRATPLPGPGVEWWQIDVLGFDQRFLSVLSLITSGLALAGMVALRPLMARESIARVVVMLTVASAVLMLPLIGLYHGLHHWTSRLTGGVVDAHFIAVLNTALGSPLAQVAMIPMLAWIARNAPAHLKATFFAVMASFTNLALSASGLGTRYLNEIFTVTREIRDRASGAVTVAADYAQLGHLLVAVLALTVALPLLAVAVVQASRLRTTQ
ncbi:MAG: amidohydrolase family protein [Rhodospirillales bacterium]|nr:MAG: amidohydrolase family protein [Rhodospirillales bacterium]